MRLFRQFIVRPLFHEKIRTITTVLGVSLGIAVVIAIQLTNAASVRGFATALETIAGKTAVEIVGSGTGIDESLIPQLGWLREFGIVSPVIEGSAALVVGDVKQLSRRQMEAVKILGVDILRDESIRDYQLLEIQKDGPTGSSPQELNTQQFLEILTSPQTVVITGTVRLLGKPERRLLIQAIGGPPSARFLALYGETRSGAPSVKSSRPSSPLSTLISPRSWLSWLSTGTRTFGMSRVSTRFRPALPDGVGYTPYLTIASRSPSSF